MTDDPHNLARFVEAQSEDFSQALGQLRAGRKEGHWIWYVFPQLTGLGVSETSRFYGLSDLAEARAYLAHPILGPRLRACVQALLGSGAPARDALGAIDAMKLRSSLTLFACAAPDDALFAHALECFFPEGRDENTLARLRA